MSETKKYRITVYPYAIQFGSIDIPKELTDRFEIFKYIKENWDLIDFEEPYLDYESTDWEFEDQEL